MLKSRLAALLLALFIAPTQASDESPNGEYAFDIPGMHAFIQFRIKHLGYSWLWGRFDSFDGQFTIDDDNLSNSKVSVTIDMNSINTNHERRDKHLRDADFFEVNKYPTATFVSTGFERTSDKTANMTGKLTIKDVTKEVVIPIEHIGGGADPWGGYRQGFEGKTTVALKDFNIMKDLGPFSQEAEVFLSIEGIRQ